MTESAGGAFSRASVVIILMIDRVWRTALLTPSATIFIIKTHGQKLDLSSTGDAHPHPGKPRCCAERGQIALIHRMFLSEDGLVSTT